MPLHLIVHDFDRADLKDRVDRLRAALPKGTKLECTFRRSQLLARISALNADSMTKPIVLIDLHAHRDDTNVRGERLLRTIQLHPGLRGRAVLVAFTRYGYSSRDQRLKDLGVTAVLNPSALNRPQEYRVLEQLELLRETADKLTHIGTPPTLEDEEMISRLEEFFPNLRQIEDEQQRLLTVNRLLLICRLENEGYERTHIVRWPMTPPATDDELRRLRDQVSGSRPGRALQAQRPGAPALKLGDVAVQLFRTGARTAVITDALRSDEQLTAARLENAVDELASWEPLEEQGRDLWIPPEYVEPMRMLLGTFDGINRAAHARWSKQAIANHIPRFAHLDPAELKERFGTNHPSFDQNRNKVNVPLQETARLLDIPEDDLRAQMSHAISCLEEAAADESSTA